MIEGFVNGALEPIVIVRVRSRSGREQEFEAVVDTGFTEFLTVGSELVDELQLEYSGVNNLVLADGSVESFDVYDATVMWNGSPKRVRALVSDAIPLLGMRMLEGYSLLVEVVDGGRVVIESYE